MSESYLAGARFGNQQADRINRRAAGRRMRNALTARDPRAANQASFDALSSGLFDEYNFLNNAAGARFMGWAGQDVGANIAKAQPNAIGPPQAPAVPGAPPMPVVPPQAIARATAAPAPALAAPAAPASAPQVATAPVGQVAPQAKPDSSKQIFNPFARANRASDIPPPTAEERRAATNAAPILRQIDGVVFEWDERAREWREHTQARGMAWNGERYVPEGGYDAATGAQMLTDNSQANLAAENAPAGPVTPAGGAAAAPAPGGQADPATLIQQAQTVDLEQTAFQVAPPALSQRFQQYQAMHNQAMQFGLTDEVERMSTLMDEQRDSAIDLFAQRQGYLLEHVLPRVRAVAPEQRAQVALSILSTTPYARDADGNPLINDQAIQMIQQANADGVISDQELDTYQQLTLTFAQRTEAAQNDRRLAIDERNAGGDAPLTNQQRRVVAQQYRTEVRGAIDDLGILRPSLPYARLALSHQGDTTGLDGVNFRQADVALLRAAARAQTGPGVLTESEVWSTLSPSLQQQLTTNMAYLDVARSGISAPDRAALAQFVTQSAANVQRDAWDIYEDYEAQWGADVLVENGMRPPRIPHPDDEPYLRAQEVRNPRRDAQYSVNGRTYRYDGPGNWTVMRANETDTSAEEITAAPTDDGVSAAASDTTNSVAARLRQLQATGTPEQIAATARQFYNAMANKPAATRVLLDAVDQGVLSPEIFQRVTGASVANARSGGNQGAGPRL